MEAKQKTVHSEFADCPRPSASDSKIATRGGPFVMADM
jgi:hypothetical protein